MKVSSFGLQLLNQFNRKWTMLQEAIENCPDELWYKGGDEWIFSWIVYHIIETANFYSKDNPDEMTWGVISQIDWDNDSEEDIKKKKEKNITKEIMEEYADTIKQQINEILSNTTDEHLLRKDDFHWFNSIYEKYIYLLRHNMFHLGELAQLLRFTKCERIKWK